MVCFDEFGPIELRPVHGSTWQRRGRPNRLPATYRRTQGVRYFMAFYDIHEDKLWGYVRKRKRSQEVLEVFKYLRRRYPIHEKIKVVLDNFSPHKCKEVFQWAKNNNVEFAFTPTNASWLNRIECQFTEVKKFVFEDTYYQGHDEMKRALSKFLIYRNRRNKKLKKNYEERH